MFRVRADLSARAVISADPPRHLAIFVTETYERVHSISVVSVASTTKPRGRLLECELLFVYAIIRTNENGVKHTMKQDKDIIDRIAGECLLRRG